MNKMIMVASVIFATFIGTPLPQKDMVDNEIIEERSINEFQVYAQEFDQISESIENNLINKLKIENEKEDLTYIKSFLSIEVINEIQYASENTYIRKNPNKDSTKINTVNKREELNILYDMKNGWYLIEYENIVGFIDGTYLVKEKPAKEKFESQPKEETKEKEESEAKSFKLSFYSNLPEDNGGYTKTSSGAPLTYGVVASNVYPPGTTIELEGYGKMTVLDTGGSHFNDKDRLDVFIPPKKGENKKNYKARIRKLGRQTVSGIIY